MLTTIVANNLFFGSLIGRYILSGKVLIGFAELNFLCFLFECEGWDNVKIVIFVFMKKVIATRSAPEAIGPYSQAVEIGGMVFVSGQIPVNPATGSMPNEIGEQTKQSLENVKAILAEAGLGLCDVVKTTVFLTDMGNFQEVNRVYGQYFLENAPARACVEVSALPKGAAVEIEAIALR